MPLKMSVTCWPFNPPPPPQHNVAHVTWAYATASHSCVLPRYWKLRQRSTTLSQLASYELWLISGQQTTPRGQENWRQVPFPPQEFPALPFPLVCRDKLLKRHLVRTMRLCASRETCPPKESGAQQTRLCLRRASSCFVLPGDALHLNCPSVPRIVRQVNRVKCNCTNTAGRLGSEGDEGRLCTQDLQSTINGNRPRSQIQLHRSRELTKHCKIQISGNSFPTNILSCAQLFLNCDTRSGCWFNFFATMGHEAAAQSTTGR